MSHRPDLVVLDFSVNDVDAVLPLYQAGETEPKGSTDWGQQVDDLKTYPETFEGIVRRILNSDTFPAILVLNNAFYDNGVSVEEEHNAIASHYGIPHMSVRDRILPRIEKGTYVRGDLSPDGLHPNDTGHRLIAEELITVLLGFEQQMWEEKKEGLLMLPDPLAAPLPAPVTMNGYEHARRFDCRNLSPELFGFIPDTEAYERPEDLNNFFRNGWMASHVGDRFALDIEGSGIAVVYRKTIRRPAPVARLVLDGDEEHPWLLDGNFDQDWGDCLYLQPVLHHGSPEHHHVEIEIVEATVQDQAPFYLLSIGVSA